MREASDNKSTVGIGTVIDGRYEVLELLGEGGFASVFVARQRLIDRRVAVKVLKIAVQSEDDTYEERFLREAKIAAQLNHPNVTMIFDFGFAGELRQPFIAMELLTGNDLETEIKRSGPVTPSRCLPLFAGALDALGHGHERSIVHKDLKPSNLFITAAGSDAEVMKVLDYGIARQQTADGERLTKAGQFVGTAQYTAPEYALSQVISPAVDVYQMGLILVEALTGHCVADGASVMECLMKHQAAELDIPLELLESPLGPVVLKAVEREPELRYTNCRAFREALLEVDANSLDETFAPFAGAAAPKASAGNEWLESSHDLALDEVEPTIERDEAEDVDGLWSEDAPTIDTGSTESLAQMIGPQIAPAQSAPVEDEPTRRDLDIPITVEATAGTPAPRSRARSRREDLEAPDDDDPDRTISFIPQDELPTSGTGSKVLVFVALALVVVILLAVVAAFVAMLVVAPPPNAQDADTGSVATVNAVPLEEDDAPAGATTDAAPAPPDNPPRSVSFESAPPGASVVIGDEEVCQTPCSWAIDSETDTKVRLEKDGFDELEFAVAPDAATVSKELVELSPREVRRRKRAAERERRKLEREERRRRRAERKAEWSAQDADKKKGTNDPSNAPPSPPPEKTGDGDETKPAPAARDAGTNSVPAARDAAGAKPTAPPSEGPAPADAE